jgi:hypothetical protein
LDLGNFLLRYGTTALAVVLGIAAAWRGRWTEKSAVAVVLTAWFVSPLVQKSYTPGMPLIAVDMVEMLALFTISTFSRRIWSLMITACATGGLVSDLADVLAPPEHKMAWSFVISADFLGGLFVVVCLGFAVWECEFLRRNKISNKRLA